MSSKARLGFSLFIFLLALGGALVVFSGTPYTAFNHAMAAVSAEGYSKHEVDNSPTRPQCEGVDVSGAVQGTTTKATTLYWGPNSADRIDALTVDQGKVFWIGSRSEDGNWVQIVIACEKIWIPADAIS